MKAPNTKIGVTLFNIRAHGKTYEDLDKSLEKLRAIGYQAVQVSAIGLPSEQIKELLEKHQLFCCATHDNLANYTQNLDEVVAKHKTLECDFTALGSPGGDFWHPGGAAELAKILDDVAEKLAQQDIRLGYHNHACEFEKFDDRIFLAEIYDRTAKLQSELDVHWVARGGGSPVVWINKLAGRMPVIHFKDMTMVENQPCFAEIGEGNLDWPAIIEACDKTSVRWFVVEQDQETKDRDIFTSLQISFENMKRMGIK